MPGAAVPADPAPAETTQDPGATLASVVLPKVLHLAGVVGKTPFFVAWAAPARALLQPLLDHGIAGFEIGAGPVGDDLFPAKADALAGLAAGKRFDIFLLAPGADAHELARLISRGRVRPACVYIPDMAGLADGAQLRTTLQGAGYMLLAQFAGAEIHLDRVNLGATPHRAAINTFDVFDTLIARRCMEPHRIFEMVEAESGLEGFARNRQEAEARLRGRDYTLDDIYAELAHGAALGAERLADLKALELAVEEANVIPIEENLRLVADGDLLISDMYLSEETIRQLLRKAGLDRQVGLFVSSRGKHTGTAWQQVTAELDVTLHVGDNPHADVEMAQRFGVPTRLTTASTFNVVEDTLDKVGLRDLARLCREARLSCWHDDPRLRAAQCLQTGVNFPLLVLASVAVARKAAALGSETLLFCSRDCNLWLPLFDAMQKKLGTGFESRYFLTSRVARKKGSDAYLRYARDNMASGSLVIDLCGTGWSLAILADRIGLSACNIFLLHHLAPFPIYETWHPTPPSCVVHSLFDVRPRVQEARILELANMAEHGMMLDMRALGSTVVPVFARSEPNELQAAFVKAQRAAFGAALSRVGGYGLRDVIDLDDGSIQAVCASLLEFLSKQTPCFEMFWNDFMTEDKAVMRELMSSSLADAV